MRAFALLLFFFNSFFFNVGFSQFNVKVGYGASYLSPSNHNEIIEKFNTSNSFRLEKEMAPLHFVHGLNIGARYIFDNLGLEFSWEGLANNAVGVGEDLDGSLFKKEIFYRLNSFSLGAETYFGNKGIGASIGRRKFVIKADIADTDFKKTILEDHQWLIKLYWMIHVRGGDYIGLAFRPYIEIPLNSISYLSKDQGNNPQFELHQYLEIESPLQDIQEKFISVGVSLLFYNGIQRN